MYNFTCSEVPWIEIKLICLTFEIVATKNKILITTHTVLPDKIQIDLTNVYKTEQKKARQVFYYFIMTT